MEKCKQDEEKKGINSQFWKPKVFIGSSSEGRKIANMVKGYLEEEQKIEVVVWDKVFKITETYIERLSKALEEFDFAILVFIAKKAEEHPALENVLFELGLFMGRLGRHKAIMLYEKEHRDIFPSDLGGIHTATFSSAENLEENLKNSCNEIRDYILDPYEDEISAFKVWKKSCHHIYEALKKAPQDATIRIIQTWFPDLEDFIEELRMLLTKKNKRFKFQILLINHDPGKKDEHFDLLKARIRCRKETRESAVKKITDSIAQFVDLKKNVENVWKKSKAENNSLNLDLEIRQYDFLPFGPYYQIGDKEMFVGFYLNYCSSVNAPMVKILPTAKTAWDRFENHFNIGWESSTKIAFSSNSTGGKKEKTEEKDHRQ